MSERGPATCQFDGCVVGPTFDDDYCIYHQGWNDAYDAGYLAAEAAEEESLRRHRTELDRVRGELSEACDAWLEATDDDWAANKAVYNAAMRLLAITASRSPLPGEGP